MKTAAIGLVGALLILGSSDAAFGGSREQKLVTRVDTATAVLKGHTLVIKATGMARTNATMGKGCQLVPRSGKGVLNKDGFAEYNMIFSAMPGYTGFKMKPVSASFHDRSVAPGVKGARIFSEFNEYDARLPEPKKKTSRSLLPFGRKKQEPAEEQPE